MNEIYFRLGRVDPVLEIPPFFVNFDKRDFSSMMTREKKEGRKALFFVYISRANHLSKLLLLKAMHPDIFIPINLRINEEIAREDIDTFIESVKEVEKNWKYLGKGVWKRRFFECAVYMVLVIGDERWTIRPLVAKKRVAGLGAEIPVEFKLGDKFLKKLREREKSDLVIHEHLENRHFHFTVYSIERFIQLVKQWDYYFAHKERWEMTVKVSLSDMNSEA
jgi:hypothetical protein